ncbi:lipopolysaccharide biosynthesis protein [Qipengyuania vesicularis]|uniref:lipopolysaccharide biosynthesis protein n=1 Tax=Qipengyuania vesicularis TaxID=2867232 RepID=UPI001C88AEBC|nr:lipopolysaccharide biosynthesis protein [Qipengyuania vesicularis]MBX7526919.1 lipopolysaccharide biosynthesis protein [Qipengyuania vesicularis]
MTDTAAHEGRPRSLIARMLTDVAWLIGGKGFGAVCSLIYLAILTRSLGLKDFGHFALIFGTSQALIAIAGFQTWRTVVRFGVKHIHDEDWAGFGRLSMMAFLLDVLGAVIGCLIAYIVFYQFAVELDLNPTLIDTAFWFNVAALWALVSAPTGIVRALDRFDVAVYVEALVPAGRLIAAAVIALTGPSLVLFLIAWAVIDLIEAAVYWIVARRLSPQAIRLKYLPRAFEARHENPGLVRFFGITYLSATLEAMFKHGPLLAVGYFVGTSAAGIYRLAQQLAQGLTKLSALLSRAAYAQIARASVASAAQEFRNLASQTTKLAAIGGAIVVIAVATFGGHILALLGGEDFRNGYTILLPLVIVSSIELAGVAFEPVLHATGRARLSLLSRFVTVAVAAVAIGFLVHGYAEQGIAWSLVIGAGVGNIVMGMLAYLSLRQQGVSTIKDISET